MRRVLFGVIVVLVALVAASDVINAREDAARIMSGPRAGVEKTFLGFTDNTRGLKGTESMSQIQAVVHSELLINSLPSAFVDSSVEDLPRKGRQTQAPGQGQDQGWDFWRVVRSVANPIGVLWEPLEREILRRSGVEDPESQGLRAWWPRETLQQNRLLRSEDPRTSSSSFLVASLLDLVSSPSRSVRDASNTFASDRQYERPQSASVSQSLHKRNNDSEFEPFVFNAPSKECSQVGYATGTLENICALQDCHPIQVFFPPDRPLFILLLS